MTVLYSRAVQMQQNLFLSMLRRKLHISQTIFCLNAILFIVLRRHRLVIVNILGHRLTRRSCSSSVLLAAAFW